MEKDKEKKEEVIDETINIPEPSDRTEGYKITEKRDKDIKEKMEKKEKEKMDRERMEREKIEETEVVQEIV